jgi:hypothetical protein
LVSNKLKYIFFLIVLLFGNDHLLAQRKGADYLLKFDERKLHFGFYLGMNTMDYRFSHYDNVYDNPVFQDPANLWIRQNAETGGYYQKTSFRAEVNPPAPGFTVGGVANLRLERDFDLRFTPGISLGNRHLIYSIPINPTVISQIEGMDETSYLSTPSAYIDIPMGVRYKGFRHYNVRPFVYLGGAYRRDLENKRISEKVVHIGRDGFYAEVALGLDTYFQYFRFSSEIKFSYGLNNLIRHDTDPLRAYAIPYYGYIIKTLNSNILTFIIYFE